MTARPNDVPDVLIRSFERGLEAYLAADTIADVMEAVDLRALLAGENLDDPMEYERMGKVVGALVGRLVVRGTIGRYVPGRIAEQTVGYTVGGLVGQQVARLFNPMHLDSVVATAMGDVDRRPLYGTHDAPNERGTTTARPSDEWSVERTDDSATWTDIPIEGPDVESRNEQVDDESRDDEMLDDEMLDDEMTGDEALDSETSSDEKLDDETTGDEALDDENR